MALLFTGLLIGAPVLPQSTTGSSPRTAAAQSSTPPPPDKNRARTAFQAGRRSEQSGDWKAEFAAYSEAASYDPSNREYKILKEHARFQVVQSLVESAERQAVAGNIPEARAQLTQALDIDPNYVVARERLAELTPSSVEIETGKAAKLAGLPRLIIKPGTQTFDYRGTVRGAYEEIGKQFDVKMVFDGDLPDRAIRFRVPNLDFDTAVMVLSRQTKTFTRVVDAHTMFVTEDTAQKEKDYALEVEKQLLLPASVTPDEMNETVRMIREMTGITRTQLNTATRTLTVRSTEQNVALAQTILEQVEQPHGELMLDIEILELDRTTANQLGITPPASSTVSMLSLSEIRQLQAAQNSGDLIQMLATLFGSSAVSSASGAALPALIAFGGGKTIFLATMPGVSANFGTALSSVHSAQRVLLRAQDGKPATFFVGDRYPIDLGLLSSDLSSTSSSLASLASGLTSGLTLPSTNYDTGKGPDSVAIADFNKDGFPDIAVANKLDGSISILKGNGDGTFTIPTGSCSATTQALPECIQLPMVVSGMTPSPTALVATDFDGDGNMDLAVPDGANHRVLVYLGNGDGTFQAPASYATGMNPVALVAQDFDDDGHPDLAIVNQGDDTVSILLGTVVNTSQRVTFALAPTANGSTNPIAVGASPSAIAAGTFIVGDLPSLAVTNKTDNTVSILLGQGTKGVQNGTFITSKALTFDTDKGPTGIVTSDFDGDGNTDLAVTNETDGTISILLGNGGLNANLKFTPATNSPVAVGSGPVGIVAAPFAGTNTDLAVADESGNNVDVLIGNGKGTFSAPISLPTGNFPIALAAADLNGDATIDLVSANNTSNSVTVILNTLLSSASTNPSSAQTGYPSAQYEDLGLKVKATPRLHDNDEVTLQLQFDIKNLAGASINSIPILSNRQIEQTIRLRENETSVLSGILQTSSIRSTRGLPWISTPPGIGLLTGEDTANIQQSELLILVTPRALRFPPHNVPAIYAGRGEPSTPPLGPAPGQPGPPPPPPAGVPLPNQPPQGGRAPFGGGGQPGQAPGPVFQPQQQPPPQPDQQQPEQQQRPQPIPQQQ